MVTWSPTRSSRAGLTGESARDCAPAAGRAQSVGFAVSGWTELTPPRSLCFRQPSPPSLSLSSVSQRYLPVLPIPVIRFRNPRGERAMVDRGLSPRKSGRVIAFL